MLINELNNLELPYYNNKKYVTRSILESSIKQYGAKELSSPKNINTFYNKLNFKNIKLTYSSKKMIKELYGGQHINKGGCNQKIMYMNDFYQYYK